MFIIKACKKNIDSVVEWKLLGYDLRPLRFHEYGMAQREADRLQGEEKTLYGDTEEFLTYKVVEEDAE